jgi:hypothetical protein
VVEVLDKLGALEHVAGWWAVRQGRTSAGAAAAQTQAWVSRARRRKGGRGWRGRSRWPAHRPWADVDARGPA